MRVKRLLELAEKKGLKVAYSSAGRLIVNKAVSVLVWPDGVLTRGDVRLDLVKPLKVKEAAKLLGL